MIQPFTEWHSHESGAPLDDQLSDTPVTSAFGRRIPNATKIDTEDASKHNYRRFNTLSSHNRDNKWEYRSDVNLSKRAIYEMKLNMMMALGRQLEVGGALISAGTRQIFRVDVGEVGLPTSAVGFCLYAHLYDQATSAYEARTLRRYNTTSPGTKRPYWPFRDPDKNHPSFNRVADNLIDFHQNVSEGSLQSVLQKLAQGGLPAKGGRHQPRSVDLPS